jgi:hypothetical protein
MNRAIASTYDMLFRKCRNPLAAAAGGYILLAVGDPAKRDWIGLTPFAEEPQVAEKLTRAQHSRRA